MMIYFKMGSISASYGNITLDDDSAPVDPDADPGGLRPESCAILLLLVLVFLAVTLTTIACQVDKSNM